MAVHSATTWLEPIPGLWRDEAAHRYWLGDHLFPVSITGVLAHGLSEIAKRTIEAKRPIWEPRGVTLHAAPPSFRKVVTPVVSTPWGLRT